MPSKEEMRKYLEGQREAILGSNFRNELAKELNARRLKSATDKEVIRAIEDENDKMVIAEEGNAEYLAVIEEFLEKL